MHAVDVDLALSDWLLQRELKSLKVAYGLDFQVFNSRVLTLYMWTLHLYELDSLWFSLWISSDGYFS